MPFFFKLVLSWLELFLNQNSNINLLLIGQDYTFTITLQLNVIELLLY